jgi:DNA helicase-2/ATP-dependent DNA helicase PcrA
MDLSSFNDMQREAVTSSDGPLLIIAGAGSGKTRVLINRIAHLIERGVYPYHIMAVTFTNKAAKEIKERLISTVGERATKVWYGTFHSMALRILRIESNHLSYLGYTKDFTIYDDNDTTKLIKKCTAEYAQLDPNVIKDIISFFKNRLWTPDQAMLEASKPAEKIAAKIYESYQSQLRANNAMDFDDIIMITAHLLMSNEEIRNKYQDKFEHVLVDEYQDINYSQYKLVTTIAEKHRNIFVVGDDFQSIYSFRGSDISMILNFENDYPDAKVVKLEQNYRCTKTIVEAANSVISNNTNQKEKELWTNNAVGDPIYRHVSFSDLDEATWVVSCIKQLVSEYGYKAGDCVILYRTNAQSRQFEDCLLRNRMNYTLIGGVSFYERREIRDTLAYIKAICNPSDALALKRIINVPKRGIGDATIKKLEEFASENGITLSEALGRVDEVPKVAEATKQKVKDFSDMMHRFNSDQTPAALLNDIIETTGYVQSLADEKDADAEDRISNLDELLKLCQEYHRDNETSTIRDFIQDLSLLTDGDRLEAGADAVKLMTVHNAKGLEWPIVFVVGLEEGIFPHFKSQTEAEVEEERRLFYVAMTRAKELLYVTSSDTRSRYGQAPVTTEVSRFIEEIPPNLMAEL